MCMSGSTKSCSTALRSCGGLSFVTCCITLLKQPLEDVHTVVMKGQQQNSGRLWCLNNPLLVLRNPKCDNKASSKPLNHHQPAAWTVDTRLDAAMLSCCLQQIQTLTSIKTHQTRQQFSICLLFYFAEPMWIVESGLSCQLLTCQSGAWCGLFLL